MVFPFYLLDKIIDVQDTRPEPPFSLTKVGVEGLTFRLRVVGKAGETVIYPKMKMYIDLPRERRGAHLSRNLEALYEVLDENPKVKSNEITGFCIALSEKLLQKHDYARRSWVSLISGYMMDKNPPLSKFKTLEGYNVFSSVMSKMVNDKVESLGYIGVEVEGFTSCPCSQNLLTAWALEGLKAFGIGDEEVKRILDKIPTATHTQRTFVTVKVQEPQGFSLDVEDLISLTEGSLSGATYALLKRPSEATLLRKGFDNPKFAEDVVRDLLYSLLKFYKDMPDDVSVFVRVRSQESVHKHDVVVESNATFGSLRRELNIS